MIDPDTLSLLFRRWERRSPLIRAERAAFSALPFRLRTFRRDEYVVREGEPAKECGLLLRGFAFRQKTTQSGARQIISLQIPGEFVDLQNYLLGRSDHNVQALTEAEFAMIPVSALTKVTASQPGIGRAMWLDTLVDSSVFREWVVNVGRRDARTRIAHLLCELSLRLQASASTGYRIREFPLTQQHIADATGLTAVHTNRTLQALRQDGLISLAARSLTVLDWPALKEAGEFTELYLHHAA
jgi:CRP-like cAMP-binding protein